MAAFSVSASREEKNGLELVIRYRVRAWEGKWRDKAETLDGLGGKKAAHAIRSWIGSASRVKRGVGW